MNTIMNNLTKKITVYTGLLFIFVFIAGCSTTSLVNSWSDPKSTGPALQKILVIGVIKDDTMSVLKLQTLASFLL